MPSSEDREACCRIATTFETYCRCVVELQRHGKPDYMLASGRVKLQIEHTKPSHHRPYAS